MDRILRISPIFLFSFSMVFAPNDTQAKPPELPATPNDQCLIPALFNPEEWNLSFSLMPLEFRVEVPQTEAACMPSEIEILTVPPREVPTTPTTLRRPDIPAIDSQLILNLEKIEGKAEAYRVIDREVRRVVTGVLQAQDKR
jgi:hypothetical protein